MKTSPKMQEIVTTLAAQHGLTLTQKGAYLRLDMPHSCMAICSGEAGAFLCRGLGWAWAFRTAAALARS
jgi:hypothetical protein